MNSERHNPSPPTPPRQKFVPTFYNSEIAPSKPQKVTHTGHPKSKVPHSASSKIPLRGDYYTGTELTQIMIGVLQELLYL